MNHQTPEKPVQASTLQVHSIFHTIQGEGPFTGHPAVFIRLAGCNLQCPQCDTEYTSNRMEMTPNQISKHISTLLSDTRNKTRLIVITGGEPFRQQLADLFDVLLSDLYFVQVETNGTLPPPDHRCYSILPDIRAGVYIVCSPKTGKVHPRIAELACAFKYVGGAKDLDHIDGLPLQALGHPCAKLARPPELKLRPVYLQPMDEHDVGLNKVNTLACVDSCMKHGYTLQLQTHKILNLE